MLQEIKRQAYLQRKTLLLGPLVAVGAGLIVSLVVALVARFDPGVRPFSVGGLAVPLAGMFYYFILCMGSFGTSMNLSLKMGATRRQYALAAWLLHTACMLGAGLLGLLYGLAERAMLPLFLGPLSFSTSLPLWLLLPAALAGAVMGMWMGGLLQAYGRKGFWVVYAIFMAGAILGSQVGHALNAERTDAFARAVQAVAAFFSRIALSGVFLLGAAAVLLMLGHSVLLLRRVAVQN